MKPSPYLRFDGEEAGTWLARHNAGEVPAYLAAAQETLDRAVEGGFFDEFEGRSTLTGVELRREIQARAADLLEEPEIEVWFVAEKWRAPDGKPGWRTRLLAVPR